MSRRHDRSRAGHIVIIAASVGSGDGGLPHLVTGYRPRLIGWAAGVRWVRSGSNHRRRRAGGRFRLKTIRWHLGTGLVECRHYRGTASCRLRKRTAHRRHSFQSSIARGGRTQFRCWRRRTCHRLCKQCGSSPGSWCTGSHPACSRCTGCCCKNRSSRRYQCSRRRYQRSSKGN
jgi:hypothetical protein